MLDCVWKIKNNLHPQFASKLTAASNPKINKYQPEFFLGFYGLVVLLTHPACFHEQNAF